MNATTAANPERLVVIIKDNENYGQCNIDNSNLGFFGYFYYERLFPI
jgi:hypothetical protein